MPIIIVGNTMLQSTTILIFFFFFSQPAFIVWFQHLFVLRLNLAQQKGKKKAHSAGNENNRKKKN